MTILAVMKNGQIKKWYAKKFAWVYFRDIFELQEDIEQERVKYISLIHDDGTFFMRKGLRMCYEPNFRRWGTHNPEIVKVF